MDRQTQQHQRRLAAPARAALVISLLYLFPVGVKLLEGGIIVGTRVNTRRQLLGGALWIS